MRSYTGQSSLAVPWPIAGSSMQMPPAAGQRLAGGVARLRQPSSGSRVASSQASRASITAASTRVRVLLDSCCAVPPPPPPQLSPVSSSRRGGQRQESLHAAPALRLGLRARAHRCRLRR